MSCVMRFPNAFQLRQPDRSNRGAQSTTHIAGAESLMPEMCGRADIPIGGLAAKPFHPAPHADGSKHVVMATSESRAKRQKQPSIDQRDNSTPYILWGSACLSRRDGRRAAAGLARLWRTTNAAPYLVCTCHRSRLQGPTAPGQPVGTTADATVRRRASVPAVARINGLESNVISRGDRRRTRDLRVRDAAARAEHRRPAGERAPPRGVLFDSATRDQRGQIDILSTVFINVLIG